MTLDPNVARHIDAFNLNHKLQNAAHRTLLTYLLIEPPRPADEASQRSRGWAKESGKDVLSVSEYELVPSTVSQMASQSRQHG